MTVVRVDWEGIALDNPSAPCELTGIGSAACRVRVKADKPAGWLARLRPQGHEARKEFRKGPRVREGLRTFTHLEDGVWLAGAAETNGQYSRRVWFRVCAGRVDVYATSEDAARSLLGLPPWRDVAYERAREQCVANRMPELDGSDAQKRWAEQIRAGAVALCPSELLPALRQQTRARWWIEGRALDKWVLLGGAVYLWYGIEKMLAGEAVGRALADELYALVEQTGEVPRVHTQVLLLDQSFARPLHLGLTRSFGVYWQNIVVEAGPAYRARWQELLARQTLSLVDTGRAPLIVQSIETPQSEIMPPGSVWHRIDTGETYVSAIRGATLAWVKAP